MPLSPPEFIGPPPPDTARLWQSALLGVAAGLPLPLSAGTLRQWLADDGLTVALVSLTAGIALPYSLKPLWAPLLDRMPPLTGRFGRRRGWLLLIQPALAAAALGLAFADPVGGFGAVLALGAAIAFLSASQDIAIDAWRIEVFPPARQGAALAAYVWGYRAALLIAGSGVIGAAALAGWRAALLLPVGLLCLSPLLTWRLPAPATRPARGGVVAAFAGPVGALLRGGWMPLLFVGLFKLGDQLVGPVTQSLYRSLGYSLAQISAIGPFQILGAVGGVSVGGALVYRLGPGRALLLTGVVQTVAITFYLGLLAAGGDPVALIATVMAEAFAQGMADAAFLTFLAMLCAPEYAAMQYAILSSLAALGSHTVAGVSGWLVQAVGWTRFFGIATFAAVPAMLLMRRILRRGRVAPSGPRRPSADPRSGTG